MAIAKRRRTEGVKQSSGGHVGSGLLRQLVVKQGNERAAAVSVGFEAPGGGGGGPHLVVPVVVVVGAEQLVVLGGGHEPEVNGQALHFRRGRGGALEEVGGAGE